MAEDTKIVHVKNKTERVSGFRLSKYYSDEILRLKKLRGVTMSELVQSWIDLENKLDKILLEYDKKESEMKH